MVVLVRAPRTRWTDERDAELLALRRAGRAQRAIADRMGLSFEAVRSRLRTLERGLVTRRLPEAAAPDMPIKSQPWDVQLAIAMYERGCTTTQIGKVFGMGTSDVSNRISFAMVRAAAPQIVERKCLYCSRAFKAYGRFNRICTGCKATEAYQGSGGDHSVALRLSR